MNELIDSPARQIGTDRCTCALHVKRDDAESCFICNAEVSIVCVRLVRPPWNKTKRCGKCFKKSNVSCAACQ